MIRRKILVAILITCLTVTSCISFTPQVQAAEVDRDYGGVENEHVTLDPDKEQAGFPVINGWDEEGFYRDANGEIVMSTYLMIDGVFYKFDAAGSSRIYTGQYNGIYYKNGKPFTGWLEELRYKDGKPLDGWFKSKRYKNGKLLTGVGISAKGVPFYYTKGVRNKTKFYQYKNLYYIDGKIYHGIYGKYYYNKGKKITKYKTKVKKMSDGKFYFFKKDGTVFKGTGWKRADGKRYYIKNGKAYTGWHYVGNYKYFFHKTNASLCQDLIACKGKEWKKKDLFIKVNRKKNCVTIYAKDGKNGYTIPVKALACSVGKKSSPTIKGTYTMEAGSGKTYRWHLLGGPGISAYCYGQYCVRIHKSWLFHSVTYDKPDKMTLQTYTYNQLGTAASHGCIRLQVIDAKLVYDIVNNRDTKVKIYDSDYTGPFDKPVIKKIPKGQKYDPTDPYVKK